MSLAVRPLGFARWIVDDVTIDTVGETSIDIAYDDLVHTQNESGSTPDDIFRKGITIEATGFFVYSLPNLKRVLPELSSVTTDGIVGAGGVIDGVQGSTNAVTCVIHPRANSATTDDIRIIKGIISPNGAIVYGATEDDGRIPVKIVGLYDSSATDGQRLFKTGADA